MKDKLEAELKDKQTKVKDLSGRDKYLVNKSIAKKERQLGAIPAKSSNTSTN
jgi:hypothetical protein